MKNFTNNFKQFTSRLSARWLIMALMLLVGTSSAWAYYVTGWNGDWNPTQYNMGSSNSYTINNVEAGVYEFKITDGTWNKTWGSGCLSSTTGTTVSKVDNGDCGSNAKIEITAKSNVTIKFTCNGCYDKGGASIEVSATAVQVEPSAYSLGGYINKSDVNSYSDTYKLTKQSDGTYKRTISFTQVHNNAQYLWIIDDLGNKWGVSSDTDLTTGNSITLTKGVESGKVKAIGVINTDYVFIFNPSDGVLSYLASCSNPDFSVSLSKSEVAVGCTGVTASITGDDSPTVAWSSSSTNVATINNSTGAITIKAAGTTTIKATTTEAGGFCGGVEKTATLTVKSPSVTVSANNNSLCEGETLTLTAILTNCGADNSIQWYNGGNPINGATNTTLTINPVTAVNSGNYKAIVSGGILCSNVESTPITITVNALPSAPTFDAISAQCGSYTLPTEDKNLVNVNWYDSNGNKITSVNQSGTYYAEAVDGTCVSEDRTDVEITIKTKPTISISGNEEAVLYEDVMLTATATAGATVKWYEGGVEKGEGPTYVVTSETATSKTITAKAFLNGCDSDEASYTVNFEAEGECEHEIINNTNKTKVRVKKIDNWNNIKIYAHSGQSTGDWPGADMTAGTGEDAGYYVYTFESVSSNFKVIFNNGSSNGENQTVSGTATKGKVCTYTIGANTCSEDNNSRRCLTATTTDYKTTGDVIITAPAVKTVSATSEEGSGIVTFTGKLLKTGCATGSAIWVGYQYKKANEDWPTTDVTAGSGEKQLASISNNPGSEDFTTEVNVENLIDGDYHFRAYIINGYNFTNGNYDQGVYYGLDKLVTVRNTKTAIKSVALQHADEYGNPILSTPTYCAGTTAYLLLTYVGSRPDEVNWSSTLSNTITKVDGNLYQFTVAGSETITVSAKNEENIDFIQGTIDVAAYSIPLTPMVELDKSEICSNDEDGATITVTNAQDGIQYYLYETGDDEAVQGPITGIGSLAFTKIKTAATYYVSAVNSNCPTYKVESQKRAITVIDASQNTIAIEPTTKTINPWGTVTLNVTKNSQYDYTLKCMQEDTDVTANLVINKKGDTYSIKFPKPSTANIVGGQVTFSDIIYIVTVTLDGSVQCGTTSATSTVTLTNLIEDCD